ncbi:MAG: nuclear transport factor 2 family protein [Bacteroidetes bacterium]|nr:nuclear transport factor 2 family protein [Bacteroidota bacterium]
MNTPESAAQRQLDAYNARDITAFCAAYTSDVELINLLTGEVFCSGIEQMRQRYGRQFEQCSELHCKLTKRIVCGNVVIDEEQVSGLVAGQLVHATAIYEIQEGFIARGWFVRE